MNRWWKITIIYWKVFIWMHVHMFMILNKQIRTLISDFTSGFCVWSSRGYLRHELRFNFKITLKAFLYIYLYVSWTKYIWKRKISYHKNKVWTVRHPYRNIKDMLLNFRPHILYTYTSAPYRLYSIVVGYHNFIYYITLS